MYYGTEKALDLRALCGVANAATAPHVLITSYGTILSEFTQIASNGGSLDGHRG